MKTRALIAIEPTREDRPGIHVGEVNVSVGKDLAGVTKPALHVPMNMSGSAYHTWRKRNHKLIDAVNNLYKEDK